LLFALGYLLFFAIDILLANNFWVLGMMYTSFLTAGVGVFTIIFMLRRMPICLMSIKPKFLIIGFLTLVSFISFRNLIGNQFLIPIPFIEELYESMRSVIAGIASLLLVLFFIFQKKKNELKRWMIYSLIAILCHFLLWEILSPVPPLIYRYYGIMDLIILFGWLMIVHTLLKEELRQSGYYPNTSFC